MRDAERIPRARVRHGLSVLTVAPSGAFDDFPVSPGVLENRPSSKLNALPS